MDELLSELLRVYCNDLNGAWLRARKKPQEAAIQVDGFASVIKLICEAYEQGYEFQLTYDPAQLVELRVMHTWLEEEMLSMGDWPELGPLQQMIARAEEQGWHQMLPYYRELRSRFIQSQMEKFADQVVRSRGPFFPGKEGHQIVVYGATGDLNQDMLLVTILFGHSRFAKGASSSRP